MELLVLWLVMGGVGAVIANARGSNPWAGFGLGLLLGPIGWIISALTGPQKKRCQYCGERVLLSAKVCKHCGAVWRTPAEEAAVKAAAASSAAVERPSPLRTVEDLERLAALRDRGVLTEEEFVAKKRHILGP